MRTAAPLMLVRHMGAIAAVALVLTLATGARAAAFPRFPSGCSRADYPSGGKTVRAEFCRARSGGSGVVAVVLHGCGGFSTFDHRLATSLPKLGIATLDVDYFGLTPPTNRRGFCRGGGSVPKAMPIWIRVANDAGASLRKREAVRAVGIVGWSLGGDLALAVTSASRGGGRFNASAVFSADVMAVRTAAALPPTILLFGGKSDRLLLLRARRLRGEEGARIPLVLYSYGGGTHAWRGSQGLVGIAEAAVFLLTHVH
jgi:dienelactone hydrolase